MKQRPEHKIGHHWNCKFNFHGQNEWSTMETNCWSTKLTLLLAGSPHVVIPLVRKHRLSQRFGRHTWQSPRSVHHQSFGLLKVRDFSKKIELWDCGLLFKFASVVLFFLFVFDSRIYELWISHQSLFGAEQSRWPCLIPRHAQEEKHLLRKTPKKFWDQKFRQGPPRPRVLNSLPHQV